MMQKLSLKYDKNMHGKKMAVKNAKPQAKLGLKNAIKDKLTKQMNSMGFMQSAVKKSSTPTYN